MRGKGIDLRLEANPAKLEPGVRVTYDDGATQEVDLVLFATGRGPNTAGLGLEAAGVRLDADGAGGGRRLLEDLGRFDPRHRRRHQPHQPDAGGNRRGHGARAHAVPRPTPTPVDHVNVPTAVFADPNVATVGLSEEAARRRHGAIDIYQSSFRALKHTLGARARTARS